MFKRLKSPVSMMPHPGYRPSMVEIYLLYKNNALVVPVVVLNRK